MTHLAPRSHATLEPGIAINRLLVSLAWTLCVHRAKPYQAIISTSQQLAVIKLVDPIHGGDT